MILQNISLRDATRAGKRRDKIDGPIGVIIRILDHLQETFPSSDTIDRWFDEEKLWPYQDSGAIVHEFRFNNVQWLRTGSIQRNQAEKIAVILLEANKNNQNVLVHCIQGESRSAAVVKAALKRISGTTCPTPIPYCNTDVQNVIEYHLLKGLRPERTKNA